MPLEVRAKKGLTKAARGGNYKQRIGKELCRTIAARSLISKKKGTQFRSEIAEAVNRGLSPVLVSRIFEVITRLNGELGIPVLLVEQNVFRSLGISSQGYVLERGKIVLQGKSTELLKNPAVESAYTGV